MAWKNIKKISSEWYQRTLASDVKAALSYPYAKEISAAVVIVLVAAAIFLGYRLSYSHKEGSAQVEFAKAVESYQGALRGAMSWPQLEILLQTGYEQHKKSHFAPYFLLYMSEAQIKQNKLSDAVLTMDHLITELPKDSPLINLYKTKRALMGMDLSDAAAQQAALEQLRVLAYDKENNFNDYALYYLGLFTANQGDTAGAQKIWKDLVESQRHEQRLAQSPWAALAKEKLAPCGDDLKA